MLENDNLFKKSLLLHLKTGGKIEIRNKVGLRSLHDLALCYTPGVGAVSLKIYKNKGLVRKLTFKKNSVAVISDGSAVLGLGNVGPEAALPVMEGKAALFKKLAGIDAIPIVLKTRDEKKIAETIKIVSPAFGGINLEDISAPRCFYVEKRLKKELDIPIMHDDQHGTAIVVLAALINALKAAAKKITGVKIVISGAGAAGAAVAKILLNYGAKNLVVADSRGIIYSGRPGLENYKKELARITNSGCLKKGKIKAAKCEKGRLKEAVRNADVFIGLSAPKILTADMVKTMKKRPIVFALANPIPEIMPEEAKKAGAFIIATGRSDFPNQINNALVFPGIFRGALDRGVRFITEKMKIKAAENLAAVVKKPRAGKIIPSVFSPKAVKAVAAAVR